MGMQSSMLQLICVYLEFVLCNLMFAVQFWDYSKSWFNEKD